MGRAKQSAEDRATRLNEGRCPIHGLWMPQVDLWYVDAQGKQFTIVGCPRRDCDIEAKAQSIDGPWELFDLTERSTWSLLTELEAAQDYLAKHGLVAVPRGNSPN